MKTLGIYIHAPFCRSRCIYCDFTSSVGNRASIDKYVEYLCRQIRLASSEYAEYYKVDTLYFGGGTPTLLSDKNFQKIASALKQNFQLEIKEFSVEANPCSLDEEKLKTLENIGATRISIGVQSFGDALLKMLGRRHDRATAIEAIKLAKDRGFDVSVDCMLGLPSQTLDDVKEFVEISDSLGVGHISAYMLSVEDGTPLQRLVQEGALEQKSDDELAEFYEYACDALKERGYARYEVSNFCKNSKQCIHNLKYWKRQDYLGLGLSAHSLTLEERWRNSSDFEEYYSHIESGELQRLDREKLNAEDRISETVMLALRLEEGLDIEEYNRTFCEDFAKKYARALAKNAKFINFDGKRLSIKGKYFSVMNSIAADFLVYV